MSHRRPPNPRQPALEGVLRNALRLAADSIEPGADGLDRIRAKISARQGARLAGWRTAAPIVLLWPLLLRLEPAVIWVRYAAGVVADRFRPESERPGGAGWIGWLRPAAAVATGVFVVAAASWAIAALPQVIAPAKNSGHYHPGGGGSGGRHAAASSTASGSSRRGLGNPQTGSPAPSSSCVTTSASPSTSPSGSPTTSPSPSPTTTSPNGSPSTSPSASPSGSPSGSPSQSPSTSAATSTGSQAARQAAARAHDGAVSPTTPGIRSARSNCGT